MAIEIPRIAADRLSHPDWGPVQAPGRFVLPAAALLGVLENTAAPAAVLDALRRLAAGGAGVQTLLAPERGAVQLLLEGRRIALAGDARDAVLTLLGETAHPTPAAAAQPASAAPDAFLAARVAAVDAQVQEARAHAGEPPAADHGLTAPQAAAAVIAEPLLHGADAQATAAALARAVGQSGLFLEAHVAQWLRGERTLGQLQAEVRALGTADPSPSDPEGRAGRQIDALQRQQIPLEAQAWPGQPMQLQIACDPDRPHGAGDSAEATGLFQATLSLQLPRLGLLRARIRVLHDTVGLQIDSERSESVAPGLARLSEALGARGLQLVALALAPADSGAAEVGR